MKKTFHLLFFRKTIGIFQPKTNMPKIQCERVGQGCPSRGSLKRPSLQLNSHYACATIHSTTATQSTFPIRVFSL